MRCLSRVSGSFLALCIHFGAWAQSEPPHPGLEVHLARRDETGAELVYPCCKFQPPAGFYRVWLQGEWRMTPFSMLVGYSGLQPAEPRNLASFPTIEAGRVTLSPEEAKGRNLDLRLLHAGTYLEREFPRWELSPRKAVSELGEGMLMPEGRAIGALWDRKSKKYVALSSTLSDHASALSTCQGLDFGYSGE